jgi:hypothetical protein
MNLVRDNEWKGTIGKLKLKIDDIKGKGIRT